MNYTPAIKSVDEFLNGRLPCSQLETELIEYARSLEIYANRKPQTGYTLSQKERDAIGAEYLEKVAKKVPMWGMYNWLNEQAAKLREGE